MANRIFRTVFISILVVVILLGVYFNPRSIESKDSHRNEPKDNDVGTGVTRGVTSNRGGYVIGWDFHEGQTSASRNLLALIHWASDMNLTVVEPCVHDSFFNVANCVNTMDPSSNSKQPLLLFRDYFDIDYWNHQTLSHKIGKPLLAWETFIENMPNEAIIVYTWPVRGKKAAVFINDEIEQNAVECYHVHDAITIRPQFSKQTFSKLGIKITREVCFRFDNLIPMDLQWFNNQILGDRKQSDVLILFTYWTGVLKGRMYFNKVEYRHMEAYDYLKPSPRVVEHSKKYAEQFLEEDNYVAVQLRTVKITIALRHLQHSSQEDIQHFFTKNCSHQISKTLKELKGKRLLALDLGRFGDREVSRFLTDDSVNKLVPKLVSSVYGKMWNQAEWEDSFVQATGGITDSGYIAMMQKILVSNAACVVIGGGGQFHNSLMREYMTKKDPCVYEVCKL